MARTANDTAVNAADKERGMPTWLEHARFSIQARYVSRFGAGNSEIDHDNFAERLDELLRFADAGQYSIVGVIPIVATIAWSSEGMTRNDTTGAHVLLERRVEISEEEFAARKRYQSLRRQDAALRQQEECLRKSKALVGLMNRLDLQEGDMEDFMTSERYLRKEKGLFGVKYFLGQVAHPSLEAARQELAACRAAIAEDYRALSAIREERAACAREMSELETRLAATAKKPPAPDGRGC